MLIWKRKRRLPDGTEQTEPTYSYRFEWQGKVITRKTLFADRALAERAAKDHRHALQVGAYDLAHQLRMRKAPVKLPLADIVAAYLSAPPAPRRANPKSRTGNVGAFRAVLRAADLDMESAGADALKPEVVWNYKAMVEKKAAAETEDRRQQMFRSANSVLRQARSLFSKDMLEYYSRQARLELPDLNKFLGAPGFKGVAKLEYDPPPDAIVAKTFSELERLIGAGDLFQESNLDGRNMYVACWLALGFGLRASEISKARRNWFVTLDGATWCAGSELAKNKKFPRVRVQLGAWQKLAPHIEHLKGDDFVLLGSETERKETVFRRISEWMRGLGWNTQHHVHELRAWAGCQIAEKSPRGLLDAQTFLRHAQYTTTEKFYGHHMKRRLNEVKLELPAPSAPLELKVINGGGMP
jgi:integrase